MTQKLFTTMEVARQLGVLPRIIADFFYQGRLDEKECPSIGGRRIIPASYVPTIRKVLQKAGKLADE